MLFHNLNLQFSHIPSSAIVFVYEFFPHSFTVLEHYFGSIPNAECLRVPFQKNQSMSAPFKKFPEGYNLTT